MKKNRKETESSSVKPSLQEEIALLKQQIGGYKTSNEKYKLLLKMIKEEKNSLEVELGEVKGKLEFAKENISSLQNSIKSLKDSNFDLKEKCYVLNMSIDEFNALPWYKRMFKKV